MTTQKTEANRRLWMQGVANRDIKLENTLLDGTTKPLIKICDFGYSKVSSEWTISSQTLHMFNVKVQSNKV